MQQIPAKPVLSSNATGITIDFPLSDDDRDCARRHAWMFFQVGVFVLVGTVFGFAIFHRVGLAFYAWIVYFPFIGGLLLLIVAAHKGTQSWQTAHHDDDVRQLAVSGNLLVRTTRDHRKQVWYRDEIKAIQLDDRRPPILVVVLENGESAILAIWDDGETNEPERVASALRQALNTPVKTQTDLSHAIQLPRKESDADRFTR